MSDYSKFNIVYRLQKWMDSVPGQTFLNYAYSWGASIVIAGTLFKLTHLPGANIMLFLGMGTEVVVFFLSAFDRPFDKTADGRDIPTHVTEEYLEQGLRNSIEASSRSESSRTECETISTRQGGEQIGKEQSNGHLTDIKAPQSPIPSMSFATETVPTQPTYVPQMSAEEAEALNQAQGNYVEELKQLVETLKKVNEQSSRLTRDSEEMENLNRTLTGISKVYEMQLKGASQQIGTIDQINEQSRKMANQIDRLNQIYARMIEAMTVNMHAAAPNNTPE